MLDKIRQSKFGEHNLILYEDYDTLCNIRLEYCKTTLESLNEMVFLLSDNVSISNFFLGLKNTGLDVQKYRSEGSLIVVESKKGYFGLTNELVDLMIMINMLLQRLIKLDKSGLTIFSDKALFFHYSRIDDLIKHEAGRLVSLTSSKYHNRMKTFCYYNTKDFESLTGYQKQMLIDNHT
jgi:hypothetical protein